MMAEIAGQVKQLTAMEKIAEEEELRRDNIRKKRRADEAKAAKEKAALEQLLQKARSGDIPAQQNLISRYKKDETALKYLKKELSEKELSDWCKDIAEELIKRGKSEVVRAQDHYLNARKYLEIAAQLGDGIAKFKLGQMCKNGEGTEKDPTMALDWFRKAALAGYAEAQYYVGDYLRTKSDQSPDEARESVEWLEKAADAKNKHAQYELGKIYNSRAILGKFSQSDRSKFQQEAIKLFEGAAAQEHPGARGMLEIIYSTAVPDKSKALLWGNSASALRKGGEGERKRPASAVEKEVDSTWEIVQRP